MKLLTKAIEKAFEKQGDTSEKHSHEIKVICKLFNPTGVGDWFLYERDKQNPDIFWAFCNLGDPMLAECGTISLSEIMSFKGKMGLGIERDLSFDIGEKTLKEVIDKIKGE